MLLRMAMVSGAVAGDEKRGAVTFIFVDVRKAHMNGKLNDSEFAYVSLPQEAGGGVEKLKRWLYGMRSAASAWEDDRVEHLRGEGFSRGRSAPMVMLHEEQAIRLVVWGDDFTFLGDDLDLKWAVSVMTKRYEIKLRAIFGPERHDDKEVRILNRKVHWGAERITYEDGEKHERTVVRGMSSHEDSRGLDISFLQEAEDVTEGNELDSGEASKYRQVVATVNDLAMDRPDVQFADSVLGRAMSPPKLPSMQFGHVRATIPEASVFWRGTRTPIGLDAV